MHADRISCQKAHFLFSALVSLHSFWVFRWTSGYCCLCREYVLTNDLFTTIVWQVIPVQHWFVISMLLHFYFLNYHSCDIIISVCISFFNLFFLFHNVAGSLINKLQNSFRSLVHHKDKELLFDIFSNIFKCYYRKTANGQISHLQWHIHDCCHSSCCSSPGGTPEPFPGGASWFIHMHVTIDNAWHHHTVTNIQHLTPQK